MNDTPLEPTTDQLLAQSSSINLLEMLTRLADGKRTIVYSACGLALAGLALSFLLPPLYTASTVILPPQQQRSAGASAMLSQLGGSDSGAFASLGSAIQAKSAAEMYATMIAARPIADALIERHHLLDIYHARTLTAGRKALAAHTSIAASKEGFITVSVTDRDRNQAAALTNEYVEQLRVLMHGLALSEASQRRLFYEAQMTKVRDDLAHAELSYKQTQQSSHILSPDAQAKTLLAGAADLRAELTAKTLDLERLRGFATESNPQVQMAEQQIAALRVQLAQLDTRSETSYSGSGLSTLPGAELSFLRAARELKYQESLNEMLSRQYEISRIDEAREAPIVQVIEPAIASELPSSPNRRLIAIAAFIAGLLLGCSRVLYREWRCGLGELEKTRLELLRDAAMRW